MDDAEGFPASHNIVCCTRLMSDVAELVLLKRGNRSHQDWALIHARIDRCSQCLAFGWTRGKIKRVLSQEWGIGRRSVEHYLKNAYKRISEYTSESPEQNLQRSLAYWVDKLTEAEKRADDASVGIAQASQAISALAPEQIKERASLLKLLESHRKRRYGALQDSMEIYDRIDRLRGHVHSGGSASVLIQQQFINGGQSSLNEGQRRDQLAAIGMVPAGELPMILDVPAQALPVSSETPVKRVSETQ